MRFDVITLFPELVAPYLAESVLGRGVRSGAVRVDLHDLRDEGEGKHRVVDDAPFGGGPGMVLKPGPLARWIERLRAEEPRAPVVYLSPQGQLLTHAVARRLAREARLILVCGRYEGIDDRVREHWIDEEISIGDYVVTGGELPALVLIDCVSRFVPGVVGNEESVLGDTLADGLLKYPQYTQPREFEGWKVPEVLLSGDHGRIASWRREAALARTLATRPDLAARAEPPAADLASPEGAGSETAASR